MDAFNTSLPNLTTTTPATGASLSPELLYFMQAYCILLLIAGVIGNACVLTVFISRWDRLRTYELFFVSLAIADLIGTVVYPTYKVLDIRKTQFRVEGCRTIFFLNHVSITVSSLTLTAVSIDRYIVVKWTDWLSDQRKRLSKILIAITWLMGAGFAFVFLVGKAMQTQHGRCRRDKNQTLEIVWSTMVTYSLQNFIPIVVMIFLYSLIIYELYKSAEHCRDYLDPASFHIRRQKNRKTTKLLIVVVVVFFLCVTPKSLFYIFYINDMFGMNRDAPSPKIAIINSAFTVLKMSNSCANPIIYSRLHTSFRKRMVSFIASRFNFYELYRRRASTLANGGTSKNVSRFNFYELYRRRASTLANGGTSKNVEFARIVHSSSSKSQNGTQDCLVLMRNKPPGKISEFCREHTRCRRLPFESESTKQLLIESTYKNLYALRETVL